MAAAGLAVLLARDGKRGTGTAETLDGCVVVLLRILKRLLGSGELAALNCRDLLEVADLVSRSLGPAMDGSLAGAQGTAARGGGGDRVEGGCCQQTEGDEKTEEPGPG
jgi:hypothetical protein